HHYLRPDHTVPCAAVGRAGCTPRPPSRGASAGAAQVAQGFVSGAQRLERALHPCGLDRRRARELRVLRELEGEIPEEQFQLTAAHVSAEELRGEIGNLV